MNLTKIHGFLLNELQNTSSAGRQSDQTSRKFGMSVFGFQYHFKSVTAIIHLQFQKQIWLQEARRLMLGEALDMASASSRVGYEDASYFSREYKKLFGAPTHRDIARLRSNLEVRGALTRR